MPTPRQSLEEDVCPVCKQNYPVRNPAKVKHDHAACAVQCEVREVMRSERQRFGARPVAYTPDRDTSPSWENGIRAMESDHA